MDAETQRLLLTLLLGPATAALMSWLLSRRKEAGVADQAEGAAAQSMSSAALALIQPYRDELRLVKEQLVVAHTQLDAMGHLVKEGADKVDELRISTGPLETAVRECSEEVTRLRRENASLKARARVTEAALANANTEVAAARLALQQARGNDEAH